MIVVLRDRLKRRELLEKRDSDLKRKVSSIVKNVRREKKTKKKKKKKKRKKRRSDR